MFSDKRSHDRRPLDPSVNSERRTCLKDRFCSMLVISLKALWYFLVQQSNLVFYFTFGLRISGVTHDVRSTK